MNVKLGCQPLKKYLLTTETQETKWLRLASNSRIGLKRRNSVINKNMFRKHFEK
jgi:hypothetical protein